MPSKTDILKLNNKENKTLYMVLIILYTKIHHPSPPIMPPKLLKIETELLNDNPNSLEQQIINNLNEKQVYSLI